VRRGQEFKQDKCKFNKDFQFILSLPRRTLPAALYKNPAKKEFALSDNARSAFSLARLGAVWLG
jgi:hypothetical protein